MQFGFKVHFTDIISSNANMATPCENANKILDVEKAISSELNFNTCINMHG